MSATLAEIVRQRRDAAGLSRQQLAQRSGLSVPALSHLENGIRLDPSASTVARLSRGLNVPPAELLAPFQ